MCNWFVENGTVSKLKLEGNSSKLQEKGNYNHILSSLYLFVRLYMKGSHNWARKNEYMKIIMCVLYAFALNPIWWHDICLNIPLSGWSHLCSSFTLRGIFSHTFFWYWFQFQHYTNMSINVFFYVFFGYWAVVDECLRYAKWIEQWRCHSFLLYRNNILGCKQSKYFSYDTSNIIQKIWIQIKNPNSSHWNGNDFENGFVDSIFEMWYFGIYKYSVGFCGNSISWNSRKTSVLLTQRCKMMPIQWTVSSELM